jgi:hypothetical protein
MVFLDSKTLMSSLKTWEKNEGHFEHYVVKNEYLRFDGHVDIQAKYKILWLEVPKKCSNFTKSTLFLVGAVLRQFSWKTPLDV